MLFFVGVFHLYVFKIQLCINNCTCSITVYQLWVVYAYCKNIDTFITWCFCMCTIACIFVSRNGLKPGYLN